MIKWSRVIPLTVKRKILIVDDDAVIAGMYLLKFQGSDFDVSIATDGKNALERIKSDEPDVVLMDLVLPRLDGFEVLATLNKEQLPKKPKIIILSNLGQQEEIDKGLALGADGYVVKARSTPSEVVAKVEQILGA